VVELVNPNNPGDTRRLDSSHDLSEAEVQDGDTLRVFPEAIAGAVDPSRRQATLIRDQNDMKALCEYNHKITFTANRHLAPDVYEVTFHFPGFGDLPSGHNAPLIVTDHRVQITLGADYPLSAPLVRWLTQIFHPNIRPSDGAVCLGVLRERYLPGLGLARLVHMLAEMAQYRNFDEMHPLNERAAVWAFDEHNADQIRAIGGIPHQEPLDEKLIERLMRQWARADEPPMTFQPVSVQQK